MPAGAQRTLGWLAGWGHFLCCSDLLEGGGEISCRMPGVGLRQGWGLLIMVFIRIKSRGQFGFQHICEVIRVGVPPLCRVHSFVTLQRWR